MSIGLKDLEFNDGASLKWKAKTTYWETRYALQRAWRGYDAPEVFDLWFCFVEKMPILLRKYKEHHDCLFTDTSDETPVVLTEEQTNAILDEMIFYFENCNEDKCYQRMFGVDPMDDFEKCRDGYYAKCRQAYQEMQRCWEEGMKLFTKWGLQLWY